MRGGSRRTRLAVLASAVPILLLLTTIMPSTGAATTTLGPWTETTDYGAASGSAGTGGVTVQSESCVTYSGYAYCIGGVVVGAYSSKAFFAQATTSGVGGWTETTDYGASSGTSGSGGLAVGGESCVEYGGDVYCVGGYYFNPSTHKSGSVSNVYFAPLSVSGIGAWTETTDYGAASGSSGTGGVQVSYESCVTSGSYVYCIGGKDANFNGMSKVFYAQMSSTGIGAWTETIDYGASSGSSGSGGIATDPECVSVNSRAICVGGIMGSSYLSKVFFATIGSTGAGAWTEATDYGASSGSTGIGGVPIERPACAATNTTIYCVGGYDGPTNQVFQGNNAAGLGTGAQLYWPGDEGYKLSLYNMNCIETDNYMINPKSGQNEPAGGYELICVGGSTDGDVSSVWASQIGTSLTTTTATTTIATTTTTTATTSTTFVPTTTTSSGGGIPEFSVQPVAVAALTALVAVSYLLVRTRRQ